MADLLTVPLADGIILPIGEVLFVNTGGLYALVILVLFDVLLLYLVVTGLFEFAFTLKDFLVLNPTS